MSATTALIAHGVAAQSVHWSLISQATHQARLIHAPAHQGQVMNLPHFAR